MTAYAVCAYCYGRGQHNIPGTYTVVTGNGINTACRACHLQHSPDRCLVCGFWRPDLGLFCSGCAGEVD